ncbi:hypothetical protein KIN20_024319 [Parelaphostrongylus tenuis]|uniref:Uncharacterized protein n=1 Tax=Parelaphostrongylus tenuis TaxID=148309 RepID=A0AAD5MWV1_PARTN|nr:hypothetical protein KIN20_024319 [Parelaphostrongylus tenuis]
MAPYLSFIFYLSVVHFADCVTPAGDRSHKTLNKEKERHSQRGLYTLVRYEDTNL